MTSMTQEKPNANVVTPDFITKAYGISGVKASGSVKNRQAVTQVLDATMDEADLQKFFSKFVASAPSSAAEVNKFVPNKTVATFPRWNSLEPILDIEYVMGVAPGVLTEFWWYGETSSVCPNLAKWSDDLVSKDDIPLVHSISYGAYENALQFVCPEDELEDVELNLAKLAAKGITIIFASGDSGAGYDVISKSLYNAWPASSPWVTAVGATTLQAEKPGAEMAASEFGSGGGFSRYCNKTENYDYQASAVKAYLATASGLPPASTYAAGGRATPDVSALGQEIQIVQGTVGTTFGTSASAPIFAAIVSLLNEARINAGSPPMGFLNSFLYQNPNAFTDITVGNNSMNRGGDHTPGFECAKGWDPVTGLGTPIFEKLKHAALAAAGVEAVLV
jgi:tripeptidyl-peptidase-1